MKFNDKYSNDGNNEDDQFKEANLQELEQQSKVLAGHNYEENTMGKRGASPFLSLTHFFFYAYDCEGVSRWVTRIFKLLSHTSHNDIM